VLHATCHSPLKGLSCGNYVDELVLPSKPLAGVQLLGSSFGGPLKEGLALKQLLMTGNE